jgi:hypothetical protein
MLGDLYILDVAPFVWDQEVDVHSINAAPFLHCLVGNEDVRDTICQAMYLLGRSSSQIRPTLGSPSHAPCWGMDTIRPWRLLLAGWEQAWGFVRSQFGAICPGSGG